jgi:prepilin-type processing-associated H-X9-DG protein
MSDVREPPPATAATDPAPVLSYAPKERKNRDAQISFVLGLLLVIPAIGLAAILYGRRGRRVAIDTGVGGRRLAGAGILLGWVNLALTAAFLVSLPLAYVRAMRARQQVQCLSNLRQIGLGVMMYCTANRGFFPPSLDLVSQTLTVPGRPAPTRIFGCPAAAGDPAKPAPTVGKVITSNYVYTPPAARIQMVSSPASAVVAYEPLSNHDGRTANFLFADGHATMLHAADAAKAIAELKAGQNPPPSMR